MAFKNRAAHITAFDVIDNQREDRKQAGRKNRHNIKNIQNNREQAVWIFYQWNNSFRSPS